MTEVEEKLKQLLTIDNDDETNDISRNFKDWFLLQFDNEQDNAVNKACRLEDFAVYFLNIVRQQTEVYLKSNETDTPKCTTPKHSKSQHDIKAATTPSTPALQRSLKNALTPDALDGGTRFDDSLTLSELGGMHQLENFEQSFSYSLNSNTSTPVRRASNSLNSSSQSQSRRSGNSFNNNACTTPNSTERKTRIGASSSLCLGDFLIVNTTNNSRSNKKTANSGGKPKKRVVPTKISNRTTANSSTPFANKSSFSNENNILKLSSTEIDDKNQCSILEARMSLKLNAGEISRELETSMLGESKLIDVTAAAESHDEPTSAATLPTPPKPQDKKQCKVIEKIAAIYSTLLDMNFTTNVLNELSFLINILNANAVETSEEIRNTHALTTEVQHLALQTEYSLDGLGLLRQAVNCVYFALCVLNRQRTMLAMLDLKSLSVVLYNEQCLSSDLKLFLTRIYESKQNEWQQYKKDNEFMMIPSLDKSFNNVYYQEDKDSRQNFSSNTEFGAFKSQRDIFYKTLKYWESNHLQPLWNFQLEITPRIRDIFRLSEHPVNMAHFAELFVSQLLISANYATSPEEIGVDIDVQKFSKLAQRLVAPSNFSVDYQFPNSQAFFRDFIFETRSIAFLEQLKLAIYAKLVSLNDSTLELINMLKEDDDEDQHDIDQHSEFIVRPQVLSSLQVLAKFLGYINVLPFNYVQNGTSSEQLTGLDKKQIELRSLVQPNFNIELLLKTAIRQGKLIISLPWIVQYMAMLDNVTLQLNSYVAVTQLMYRLYMHMDLEKSALLPSTVFIIRCCLGWLFETKPILVDQYYNFRISYQQAESKEIEWLFSSQSTNAKKLQVSPMLESILNVTCPFLAEFRVSIMPAKYAAVKYVSRSGRYRHITTRITELNHSPNHHERNLALLKVDNNAADSQTNSKRAEHTLIEAFLHSQNTTMRRLIEFIIERIYKSTVKDAQFKILLPSKSSADDLVNGITSKKYEDIFEEVNLIYKEARLSALKQWDESVPKIIRQRVELALDALLPHDPSTAPIVKQTYLHIICRKTESKVHQWRSANIVTTNFYCANFEDLAQKICKVNKKKQQVLPTVASSELIIVKSEPSVSNLLDELQYWLHCTSLRPELVPNSSASIEAFLHQLPLAFENKLPTALYRVVEVGIVQLLQNLISRHPKIVTSEFIKALQSLWATKEMQQNTIGMRNQSKDSSSQKDEGAADIVESGEGLNNKSIPSIFDGFVTSTFISSIGVNTNCFTKLKEVLVAMIQSNVITVNFVNDLFVPILKQDWDSKVLNEIANLLQTVANETIGSQGGGGGRGSSGATGSAESSNAALENLKSNLFMEVLADFARDVDNF